VCMCVCVCVCVCECVSVCVCACVCTLTALSIGNPRAGLSPALVDSTMLEVFIPRISDLAGNK
jgi:hypothetical protein